MTEGRSEPVCDRLRIVGRDDAPGGQRTGRVVCLLGLRTVHERPFTLRLGGETAPRKQSATTYRGDDGVEPFHLPQELEGRCSLPRDHIRSVVRMDERGAGVPYDLGTTSLSRRECGLALHNSSPVPFHSGSLHGRSGVRHDDRRRDPTPRGRPRQSSCMVARGVRRHAALCCRCIQQLDCVGGAARLEGPHLLQVLALEKQRDTGHPVQRGAGQNRRPMHQTGDAICSRQHIVRRWKLGLVHFRTPPDRKPIASSEVTGSVSRRPSTLAASDAKPSDA